MMFSAAEWIGSVVWSERDEERGRVGVVVDAWDPSGKGEAAEVKVAWEPLLAGRTSVVPVAKAHKVMASR